MSLQSAVIDYLNKASGLYAVPGFDVSVYHHHKEILRYRAGYRDVENRLPITENTLYNIYSNTKVITCVAAMQLYERGEFLLEDPLKLFFPEFQHMSVREADGTLRDAKNPVTVRDLFRMTAGFGDGRVKR